MFSSLPSAQQCLSVSFLKVHPRPARHTHSGAHSIPQQCSCEFKARPGAAEERREGEAGE